MPWNIHNVLKRSPAELGSLYGRIMLQIESLEDAEFCKHILTIAAVAYRPLTQQELASLADVPKSISSNPAFLAHAIKLCGPFLSLQGQKVYFVHQSAKDFLVGKVLNETSKNAFKQIFPLSVESIHRTICLRSIQLMSAVLVHDIYHLGDHRILIDQVHAPEPNPLAPIAYSCVYWIDHLSESARNRSTSPGNFLQDGGILDAFLRAKYLYWLEALGLLRAVSEGVTTMRRLESLVIGGKTPTKCMSTILIKISRSTSVRRIHSLSFRRRIVLLRQALQRLHRK